MIKRRKLRSYHLPPQTGKAFTLARGEVLRVIDTEGEQVADLVCFVQDDLNDYFSAGRTVDYNGRLFLTAGHVLYSNKSRPLMRITADEIGRHTCLYAPCSQEMFEISYGTTEPHPNCLHNLNMHLTAYKLSADQVGVPFNIFLNVTVAEDGELGILPPRSKAGDFIELQAEVDLIVGLSACSAGACNNFHCTAIDVEIYIE